MNCYSCTNEITTENISEEHIVPQAIGGRLKSSDLLCRKCNNSFGDSIDAALFKAFESLIALLAIKRERNTELPVLKKLKSESGEVYHLKDGRKPVLANPTIEKRENQIHVVARNEKKIQQIISGLKSKYPNLDVSNLEEKVQRTQGYMNEPLHIGFNAGGEPLLRAVGKIAINSYLCGNGDQQYIQSILEVVKGNAANDNYIHFYPVADSLHWESKEVSHLVHIRGDASKRLLYGYVVLFSSFAYIVNFSDQYGGPNLETTYCYDVVASTQVKRNFSLDYPGRLAFMAQTASEQEQHKWNNTIISTIQVNANRVLSIGNRIQINRGISEITTEVATEVFGKYPDGTIITETILQEYIEAVTAKAVPFILNANNRRTNKGKG